MESATVDMGGRVPITSKSVGTHHLTPTVPANVAAHTACVSVVQLSRT